MKKTLAIGICLFITNSSLAYAKQEFRILDTTIKSTPGFNFRVEKKAAPAVASGSGVSRIYK